MQPPVAFVSLSNNEHRTPKWAFVIGTSGRVDSVCREKKNGKTRKLIVFFQPIDMRAPFSAINQLSNHVIFTEKVIEQTKKSCSHMGKLEGKRLRQNSSIMCGTPSHGQFKSHQYCLSARPITMGKKRNGFKFSRERSVICSKLSWIILLKQIIPITIISNRDMQ